MWANILFNWGVGGIALALIGFGLSFMGMTPSEFLNAKICFSAAALLLLVGSGKWIIYGQVPIKWQVILAFIVFGGIGATWVWVLYSVDSRQASLTTQRPAVDVKLFFSQMPRQY